MRVPDIGALAMGTSAISAPLVTAPAVSAPAVSSTVFRAVHAVVSAAVRLESPATFYLAVFAVAVYE